MNINANSAKKIMATLDEKYLSVTLRISQALAKANKSRIIRAIEDQRGDVPGWVLVVLMTTGLVTAIWSSAAPRLSAILRNSLDSMNGIH